MALIENIFEESGNMLATRPFTAERKEPLIVEVYKLAY
jgi:hypothetical protein